MGKTLYIVRHATARESESGGKDFDRLLAPEGLQQSSRLGAYLYKKNTEITTILCSNAMRAVQTAEQIADQINFDISKISIDEELYEASVRIVGKKVSEIGNDSTEALIIGHNPVLSYFVEYLTGHHFEGMRTGSIVKISSVTDDWAEISNENSSFEYYLGPEDIAIEG